MAEGKFSNPRPYRDEEREIEQAFRQVTGQQPVSPHQPQSQPQYQRQVQASQPAEPAPQPQQDPMSQQPSQNSGTPNAEFFDLIPEDSDLRFDEAPQPQAPDDKDWIDKLMTFYEKNKKYVLVGLCAAALLLIVGVIIIFAVSTSDPYDGKILNNVMIADVNVGGLTKNEAIGVLQEVSAGTYEQKDMVVDLSGTLLTLSPADTKVTLDAKAAAAAAYEYGRTGTPEERENAYAASLTGNHIIGVLPYLELDKDYIQETLTSYTEGSGSTLTQAAYGLEGDEPALDYENFDENAPTQTLVITMGTPGINFDVDAVYNQILDAYSLNEFLVTVEDIDEVAEPDPVDLEAIYKEFYIAPVDASVDLQNYGTTPGSYGYGFDIEAAQKLIDKAEYGEEVRIPMEYIEPEILDDDVFFRDVLGSCETRHTNNGNRTTNLELACKAISGTVLNPGEEFSFNTTLGERTTKKGYKSAPAYSGNDLVDTIGGGICQVASTLYYSAMVADMEITARTNHSFPASYIDYGMDATVSWKSPDLKFRNSTAFPIRIEAEVSGGSVKIQILGTDARDYYVEMDYTITNVYEPETEYEYFKHDNSEGYDDGDVIREGVTGYYVKTYKLKYSKDTNDLISKDFVTNSQYKTVNKVIAHVDAPEETTEAPETTAPEETTEATEGTEATEPVETKPTETTEPTETKPAETTVPTESTEAPTQATEAANLEEQFPEDAA